VKNFSRRSATGLIAASALIPFAPKSALAQTALPGGAPDVIALLETEHREALDLIARIIASNDAHDRAAMLQTLGDALTIHNANEENIVYPAIREAAHRPDDAAMLYHQQDEGKMLIAQMTQMDKTSADFTDAAKKLQTALATHIHQENTVDFPAVRAAVGPRMAELNAQTAQLRAHWVAHPTA
jgi:iron-sulfur cluster repair protein YtfE (RIC family)